MPEPGKMAVNKTDKSLPLRSFHFTMGSRPQTDKQTNTQDSVVVVKWHCIKEYAVKGSETQKKN